MRCTEEGIPDWVAWVVLPLCGLVALVMLGAIVFMLMADRRRP